MPLDPIIHPSGFNKATVVSILPYDLNESKPLIPASFIIPKAKKGEIELLSIEHADREYYVDWQRGTIRIPESPEVVANSVVNDHIRASISTTSDARPGLFWIVGAYSRSDKQVVMQKFAKDLEEATACQIRWFQRLVKNADDMWQRWRQHRMISDINRIAASWLGVKREWADTPDPNLNIECKYCTSLISAKAKVCPICHLILDEELMARAEQAAS